MIGKEGAVQRDHSPPSHRRPVNRPQRAQVDGGVVGELHTGTKSEGLLSAEERHRIGR